MTDVNGQRQRLPGLGVRLIALRDDVRRVCLSELLWLMAQHTLLICQHVVTADMPECFLAARGFWESQGLTVTGGDGDNDQQVLSGVSRDAPSVVLQLVEEWGLKVA